MERLKEHYLSAGHSDLLFGGTPVEVYRRCGKPSCRCAKDDDYRHGPYQVVGVRVGDTVRQISLRKDEGDLFELAKHYQWQAHNRAQIVVLQQELLKKLDQMLEERTIWEKPNRDR